MIGRVLAVLALAVLAAGCGGARPNAVANLGSTSTATTSTSAPGPASGDKSSQALAYSRCMRRNGVPSFPDPQTSGAGVVIGIGAGVDPSSPQFQRAESSCRTLLPRGGPPTRAEVARAERAALAFSRCMRAHGVANFPDPQFKTGSGGLGIRIGGRSGGLDPNSPIFRAAQQACAGDLPGGGAKGPSGKVVVDTGK